MEVVLDLKNFAHKGCNIAFTSRIFFGIGTSIPIGQEIVCLQYAGF